MQERRAWTRVGHQAGVIALLLLTALALLTVAVLTGHAWGMDRALTPAPATHALARVVETLASPSASIAAGVLLTLLLVW